MGKEHKEYTWNLIAKKLAGEATPDELEELETLLRNNPELYYPLQTIADLWKNNPSKGKAMAEKAFSTHLDRMENLRIDFSPAVSPLPAGTPHWKIVAASGRPPGLSFPVFVCSSVVYGISSGGLRPSLRPASILPLAPTQPMKS